MAGSNPNYGPDGILQRVGARIEPSQLEAAQVFLTGLPNGVPAESRYPFAFDDIQQLTPFGLPAFDADYLAVQAPPAFPTLPAAFDPSLYVGAWQDASAQPDVATTISWTGGNIETQGEWVAIPNLTVITFDMAAFAWPDPSGQQDRAVQPVWYDPEHANAPPIIPAIFPLNASLLGDLWHDQSHQQARSVYPTWYDPSTEPVDAILNLGFAPDSATLAGFLDDSPQLDLTIRWTWYEPSVEPVPQGSVFTPLPADQLAWLTGSETPPSGVQGVLVDESFDCAPFYALPTLPPFVPADQDLQVVAAGPAWYEPSVEPIPQGSVFTPLPPEQLAWLTESDALPSTVPGVSVPESQDAEPFYGLSTGFDPATGFPWPELDPLPSTQPSWYAPDPEQAPAPSRVFGQPIGLTAVGAEHRIDLYWTDPPGMNPALDGFHIFRGNSVAQLSQLNALDYLNDPYTLYLGDVAPGIGTFHDTGLTLGATWFYRIVPDTAEGAGLNRPVSGAPSDPVSATASFKPETLLQPDLSGQDGRSVHPVWHVPDPEQAPPAFPTLPVPSYTDDMGAGLWEEQPQHWTEQRWFDANLGAYRDAGLPDSPTFTPSVTAATDLFIVWNQGQNTGGFPLTLGTDISVTQVSGTRNFGVFHSGLFNGSVTVGPFRGWNYISVRQSNGLGFVESPEQAIWVPTLDSGLNDEIDPQQTRSIEPRWFAPDPMSDAAPSQLASPFDLSTFPWQEQPAHEQRDQAIRWYQEPDGTLGLPPFAPTVASVAQRAALWPEQPGQEASLQPRWFAPEAAAELILPTFITTATVDQQAPLWQEQPYPEGGNQPVWYHPGNDPVNEPDFVFWLYWIAAGPPTFVSGAGGVMVDADTGDAYLSLGGPLIVKAT